MSPDLVDIEILEEVCSWRDARHQEVEQEDLVQAFQGVASALLLSLVTERALASVRQSKGWLAYLARETLISQFSRREHVRVSSCSPHLLLCSASWSRLFVPVWLEACYHHQLACFPVPRGRPIKDTQPCLCTASCSQVLLI